MDSNKALEMVQVDLSEAPWLEADTSSPEQELCYRMILRAIYDIAALRRLSDGTFFSASNMFPKSECLQAKYWVDESHRDPPLLSFAHCCAQIGINKETLRAGIYKLIDKTKGRIVELEGTRLPRGKYL